jgi:hypothetical protein
MAEIPLPSLETIEKIFGWVAQQADTWLQVVKSPKEFISKIDLTSPRELGKSLQFLAFMLVCIRVLELPIDALRLHEQVFDATTQISMLVLYAIEVLLFSSSIYFFGKLSRGKGQYKSILTAMFYAVALWPFGILPAYIAPGSVHDALRSGSFTPIAPAPQEILFLIAGAIGVTFVIIRLVPLIKFIHAIGLLRALLVVGLTGVVDLFYGYIVVLPIVPAITK